MHSENVVSIELLLDPATEAAIRAEWEALAEAGLSSLAAHTAESNRPHVTLLARRSLPPLPDLTSPRPPFAVTLGAPLLFGGGDRRVLARSVVPTAALLRLHADVHGAAGEDEDLPHTAAGDWTPHVTLARRVRLADIAAVLPLIGGEIRGRAGRLRRWDKRSATVTDLGGFDGRNENAGIPGDDDPVNAS
ncbi:2'-5' RNA ligase family protein [Microbacterium sp. NPDC078428]|uniref:2'-5' RNA ligase family protein n=1 Tax=Microbacterium sp. NPDC078428 TaxID=3364190 RepID=UPI0037C5CD79